MIDSVENKKNTIYFLYPLPQSFQAQISWHKEKVYLGEKKTWFHLAHSSVCFATFSWSILEWHVSSLTRVMRLRTFFRFGLNLLLRDSDGLSPWNISSRTNSDALDCNSFKRLQPLRIISFRYKATLLSSGSTKPAAWPIWWYMWPP